MGPILKAKNDSKAGVTTRRHRSIVTSFLIHSVTTIEVRVAFSADLVMTLLIVSVLILLLVLLGYSFIAVLVFLVTSVVLTILLVSQKKEDSDAHSTITK